MAKTKILIVEDDRSLADVLEYNFSGVGYDVFCAYDGQSALELAKTKLPELIILDVMIPEVDGLEVCKRMRANPATRETPIIMLTAKSEETDQLRGFSVGADDYVVKPFSVTILLERVKSLLRRNSRETTKNVDVISQSGITVDRGKYQVLIDDNPVELTPSEFRLLDTMIRRPGRAFDRSELIDAALGADTIVMERTIDVHIRSLRKKLKTLSNSIQTVRGVGYRFAEIK